MNTATYKDAYEIPTSQYENTLSLFNECNHMRSVSMMAAYRFYMPCQISK